MFESSVFFVFCFCFAISQNVRVFFFISDSLATCNVFYERPQTRQGRNIYLKYVVKQCTLAFSAKKSPSALMHVITTLHFSAESRPAPTMGVLASLNVKNGYYGGTHCHHVPFFLKTTRSQNVRNFCWFTCHSHV